MRPRVVIRRSDLQAWLTAASARPLRAPVRSTWQRDEPVCLIAPVPPGETSTHLLDLRLVSDWTEPPDLPAAGSVAIQTGIGSLAGRMRVWVQTPDALQRIDEVSLPGPGMHRLRTEGAVPTVPPRRADSNRIDPATVWSRTIGVLGSDVWRRLRRLRYLVIGVGRTGSLVARGIVEAWGARLISLIDPDRIEPHNLGEMTAVSPADLRSFKTLAVGRHLQPVDRSRLALETAEASLTDRAAWRLIERADVVISCVDHDSARWMASVLATLFGRPHLDLATGTGQVNSDDAALGADIRLLLPASDGRCLLCHGGLRQLDAARLALSSGDAEWSVQHHRDWRQERRGSLRSLNELAVSAALRLWEDVVAERVTRNTWLRIGFTPEGRLEAAYPRAPFLERPCPYCQLALQGEGLLGKAWKILQNS